MPKAGKQHSSAGPHITFPLAYLHPFPRPRFTIPSHGGAPSFHFNEHTLNSIVFTVPHQMTRVWSFTMREREGEGAIVHYANDK